MKRALFALAALSLSVPRSAEASFWDLYGMGPRAMGMAGACTAAVDDFSAVFYNPASLAASKNSGYGFGFSGSFPSMNVAFEKPNPLYAAVAPPAASSLWFGTHFTIAGDRATNRVALALAFSLPTRSLLSGQALDPAIPQWYMYQALPERLVFMLGLGVRPVDWLSIGVGLQVLAGLTGKLDYELDVVAGRFSRKTVTFDIVPAAAPTLGLEIRPLKGLRLGASYRAPISTVVDLPVLLNITGIANLDVTTRFTVQYNPHEVIWGASYTFDQPDLTLSADVLWALWGEAPDPAVDSRIDAGGELLEGTGLASALDTPAPGQERSVDLGFRNTLIPKFGAEWRIGLFQLRAGYSIRPSPAPLQTSGANYIDGTAHHFALGASARIKDPWGLLANPLLLDVGGAVYVIPSRHHQKIDASDPVGSYSASGVIGVFGGGIRYLFGEEKLEEAPAAPAPAPAEKSPSLDRVPPAPPPGAPAPPS
ncbi:MAG: hypothetical protein U1E65_12295 [Myxococcota bacterium]